MRIVLLGLLATLLCCQHASSDTVVIEKVICKRVAAGLNNAARGGVAALGGLIAGGVTAAIGGATVIGTGGAAVGTIPLTAAAVAKASTAGASAGLTAAEFLDSVTSGDDNLIININGHQVYPNGGGYENIRAGEIRRPNARFDFDGNCRIQFIEYDWGWGDSDNLGSIDVHADVSPGQDYRINEALLFSEEQGDVYFVTYRVERNSRGRTPMWMLCGTMACKSCARDRMCRNTSKGRLDRDKDYEDLRECPPGFFHKGWKTYPQYWPAADVYLRICGNQFTV